MDARGNGESPQFAGLEVVRRLANILQGVELNCECRSRLDLALSRFQGLESRRTAREQLANAHRQRDRIEAVFFFLRDLDELAPTEQDHSLYTEMALLFDDIATAAAEGARSLRHLSALPTQSG